VWVRRVLGWLLGLALLAGGTFAVPAPLNVYYYTRPPYYQEVDGQPTGLLLDLAKQVFERAGLPYQFVPMPVRRIAESLRTDPNACSVGWFRTPEREAQFAFPADYLYQDKPFCVIVRRERRTSLSADPDIREILQSGLELGLVDGFRYGDWLEANLAAYQPRRQQVTVGDDSGIMYRMLLGGRFEYMFAGSEEAAYVLGSNPEYAARLALVRVAGAPAGNKRYIMFSPKIDPALLARINSAIPSVRHSRAYRQVLQSTGP
jgi:uncharacterized protein (TIGR02285 family)